MGTYNQTLAGEDRTTVLGGQGEEGVALRMLTPSANAFNAFIITKEIPFKAENKSVRPGAK